MDRYRKDFKWLTWAAGAALLLVAFAAPGIAQHPDDNGIAAAPSGPSAPSGPVPVGGDWQEFSFTGVGVEARGCQPADPGGLACVASTGGNSVFADAPPWTFDAPLGGADLTVVDAFSLGADQFEVFDFGFSLGTTSAPIAGPSCGFDPAICMTDPNASKGVFQLAQGPHSITIRTVGAVSQGAAYFRVDAAGRYIQAIPALGPAGLALLVGALALAAVVYLRRKRVA